MKPTTTSHALKRTTTSRIAAFALAGTLSALTIAFAMPGGASFVAGKVLPGAGNPYETIAATEVAIHPASIHVIAIRVQADAQTERTRG
jgi:hypothetical protein